MGETPPLTWSFEVSCGCMATRQTIDLEKKRGENLRENHVGCSGLFFCRLNSPNFWGIHDILVDLGIIGLI